jgi:hypothetical protein
MADKCYFEGCNAHYDVKLDFEPNDGKPGGTGWYWPNNEADEEVAVHDHRLSDPIFSKQIEFQQVPRDDGIEEWKVAPESQGDMEAQLKAALEKAGLPSMDELRRDLG